MKYDGSGNIYVTAAASDMAEVVDDRVNALIQNGTGLTWTYDDGANTLTGNVSNAPTATALQHTKTLATSDNIAYTCTDTSIAAYADGQLYQFKMPAADCGATPTINITGSGGAIGAKGIYKDMTTACAAGDLKASAIYIMMYNAAAATAAGAFVMSGSVPAAASTTVAGIVELTIASEVNTGTSATLAITPDSLAGSNTGTYKDRTRAVYATSTPAVAAYTDSGIRVPVEVNGMDAVSFWIRCDTAPTGAPNLFTVQIVRERAGATANMLSTLLTIDATEKDSATAATACVIDATNDDLLTGDYIYPSVTILDTGGTALGLTWGFSARLP